MKDSELSPLYLIAAISCTGSHSIANSASISPASGGSTDVSFTVTCNSGYSANPGFSGNMMCVGIIGTWQNKPSCDGELCLYFSILESLVLRLELWNQTHWNLDSRVTRHLCCKTYENQTLIVCFAQYL